MEPPKRYLVMALGVALLWVAIGILVLSPGPVASLTGRDRGSYTFLGTQPSGSEPVTWDHCRAIRYQVNPTYAPIDWRKLVHAAFDDVADASGFVFVDAGTTTRRALSGGYDPSNPASAEPVLIIWSNSGRLRDLQGDTIGLGGSGAVQVDSRVRLVTGRIALDSNLHTDADPATFTEQKLVLEHEIGHVLGLGHVEDSRQVMNTGYVGQRHLGRGDVTGLRALHDVPCG